MDAIREYPQPQSARALRAFLDLVNYYRRFVPHCATLLQPLQDILLPSKTGLPKRTDAAKQAFTSIKAHIARATLLRHPKADAPTCLLTDASDIAVGAVLQQFVNGEWQPISFFSRKLTSTERRYSTFGRELLAVYSAIRHFRHFLEARSFHILTDHKPLAGAIQSLTPDSGHHSPRELRQMSFI